MAAPKRPPPPVVEDHGEDDEHVVVNAGDFLEHPQFGRCEVLEDDSSGGTRVRTAAGRMLVLRLEALRFLPATVDAEGHQLHKVAGPRR